MGQNKLNEISENRLLINQQRMEAKQQAEAEKTAAAEKAKAERVAKLERLRSTKNNFLAQRKQEIYSKIRMSVKDHGQYRNGFYVNENFNKPDDNQTDDQPKEQKNDNKVGN